MIVFYYARAYCVLGQRKCFVRNHVAIIFFFKTENWFAVRRVVNLNRNGTMGTQEQDEIPPSSLSECLLFFDASIFLMHRQILACRVKPQDRQAVSPGAVQLSQLKIATPPDAQKVPLEFVCG